MSLLKTRRFAVATTLATFLAAPLFGDGLLYTLPVDGSWILYDMHFVQIYGTSKGKPWIGTMKLSSVGRRIVLSKDEKKVKEWARWIEFDAEGTIDGEPKRIIAKMLIPEQHLKAGVDPVPHIIKGWLLEDEQVQKIKKRNTGPLPMFLAKALDDVKKLETKVVECKLGKLKCEGLVGHQTFRDRGGKTKIMYETRLHKKAPFGVINTTIRMENRISDDEIEMSGTCKFGLIDVGVGARSALPKKF